MFNGKYQSIKSILSDIYKYPFMENIDLYDIAYYLNSYLKRMGSIVALKDKVEDIHIKNHKGELPADLLYIKGTRISTDDLFDEMNDVYYNRPYISMKYASDIYHPYYHCEDTEDKCDPYDDFTYMINANKITTSFSEGRIQMSYKAIMCDEDGLPMIPDDEMVKEGLKYFILWQYAEPAYFRKDVPKDIFQEIKQQYYFYVEAGRNSLNMPSPDQIESLKNGLIRLIPNSTFHAQGYKNFTNKEIVRGVNNG